MEVECIPFRKTGYFTSLICDYLDELESLRPFYHRFPNLENFREQILEKQTSFAEAKRIILQQVLQRQYEGFTISSGTQTNIDVLTSNNTFTIVTGHQLNLFTGPLYFLYKIISTINLTRELKKTYPEYNFVPVYWMATEDHDFDEINYFNFKGKKIQWSKKSSGAVGHLSTEGLEAICDIFSKELGSNRHAETLKKLFCKAYLEHNNLTEATRFLANALFGEQGLVILDGDNQDLKRLLIPYVKRDLLEQGSYNEVNDTINRFTKLEGNYAPQVHPREINYFYLKEGLRERIIEQDGKFFVQNTKLVFSKEAILIELENHPERFSPNVICRPLYQEVILPNLCYIGGGGEIAYWLLLKSFFDASKVPFPILLLRNSALVISEKQQKKISKLNLNTVDLFLKQNNLINKKVREISNINIDFSSQKEHLHKQFQHLYELAAQTDKTFTGAVKAQEAKQLKGLATLEKRLLKAQKKKLEDHVMRIVEIQNELFPGKSLQERNLNFSELFLDMGADLIPLLLNVLDPLKHEFLVLRH